MKKFFPFSLNALGLAMQRHRALIQGIQWIMVIVYLLLIIIPAWMDLPKREAQILNNLVLFAQFVFWGIWWPFVILSMLFLGRIWCGVFCPEGALSEWTSRWAGLNKTIPRWLKWRGWPAVSFVIMTLYAQLVSVFDYAQPTLFILGGSTVAAIIIGFFFGRGTRVWCRSLCPVNGVFNLLSRLSPISFKTNPEAWERYNGLKLPVHCPPMLNIHQLNGVSACHMCGHCAGYRDAVSLQSRSFNEEILEHGAKKNNIWELRLLLYGMIGVAIGAFTWSASPWFVQLKLVIAKWLVDYNILWPLDATAPWWILTNYPENNDSFTWLDGFCISFYILGNGLVFGLFLSAILNFIAQFCHKTTPFKYHLAQAFLPISAAGLFLGLSATTVKLLQYNGITFIWLDNIRIIILAGASLWSLYLAARIIALYQKHIHKWIFSFLLFSLALIPIISSWWLMFWGWNM
ncbi:Ferredoxin [Liberibacter crescens BT-1]|uniref:Ferredoxin n=1 Tax=Liberibacter crescens (strain BT-1) TaxID=1215343 RepID=L0ETQ2_LIBCB|nr:4Fe-4S binding protein [Liberibacter crescens]AGA64924.1 Ferredoxin [Liberibacter crescens BT-1]AMC12949.1 membrane protein [Liberibacter crescens]